jgi:antitoxin HicB
MKRVSNQKEHYSYQIVLRPEPEGGYTVLVPSLPGCVTYGRTVEEANAMAEDAVRGYLLSLRKDGEKIPREDRGNIFATTMVAI